jgi:hypothetical protein
MQIRIEVEVSPEELRRFLGLPDVAGLQDDVVSYLRDKVGAAGEFDAAAFVKGNLDLLRRNPALKLLLAATRPRAGTAGAASPDESTEPATPPPADAKKPRRGTTGKRRPRRGQGEAKR